MFILGILRVRKLRLEMMKLGCHVSYRPLMDRCLVDENCPDTNLYNRTFNLEWEPNKVANDVSLYSYSRRMRLHLINTMTYLQHGSRNQYTLHAALTDTHNLIHRLPLVHVVKHSCSHNTDLNQLTCHDYRNDYREN